MLLYVFPGRFQYVSALLARKPKLRTFTLNKCFWPLYAGLENKSFKTGLTSTKKTGTFCSL